MPDLRRPVCGGVDLGGTKIEATLFDYTLSPIDSRRLTTPQESYRDLLDTLAEQIIWLRQQASQPDLPVGVGLPGLTDQQTGFAVTSNLPSNGQSLDADICHRIHGQIRLANDCKCFTLSEAIGGAGDGYRNVFGLILGTGVGGGIVVDQVFLPGLNTIAGEVGHIALPAHIVVEHQLPLLRCGCGRTGCYETYLSGAGMERLSQVLTGQVIDAPGIIEKSKNGDDIATGILQIWLQIAGELLNSLQLQLDPDCIVLGGGLSNVDGLELQLTQAMAASTLPALHIPIICKPRFGDSSGTRGAALLVYPLPTKVYRK